MTVIRGITICLPINKAGLYQGPTFFYELLLLKSLEVVLFFFDNTNITYSSGTK